MVRRTVLDNGLRLISEEVPGMPSATMRRATAWQVRKTPRRFVSITRSHSSVVMSRTGEFG